jgi:hypothetical protein
LTSMKLDANTTQVLLEFITTLQFTADNRLAAAIIIKNKVKKAFG